MTNSATDWIQLPIGSEYTAGDPSTLPEGCTRELYNFIFRPNRLDIRQPFTYDGLSNIDGLMIWEDLQNNQTRFVSLDTSGNLRLKDSGADTWGGAFAGVTAGESLLGWCNYRGKLYFTTANVSSIPTGSYSFDGVAIDTQPFGAALSAYTIAPFVDRIFLSGPYEAVAPLGGSPLNDAYDWTNVARWHPTTVNSTFLTEASGVKRCRLYPTAATGSMVEGYTTIGLVNGLITGIAASTKPALRVWRFEALGTDPLYSVPFSLEMVLRLGKADATAYAQGDMVAPANGFAYRCKVAGVTGVAVALGTVLGGDTVDGAVTWTCVSTDIMGVSDPLYVPSLSEFNDWSLYFCTASVPPRTNIVMLMPRLKFWNSESPTLTSLVPIDVALKDGLADGNPAKRNHGQQWTVGAYKYEFFNKESTASASLALQDIIWSETTQPGLVRASNSYQPTEVAGLPTMSIANKDRLVVWNRKALWVFYGNTGPDLVETPILPESSALPIGCLNSRAACTFTVSTADGTKSGVFWLSERDAFAMLIGGEPTALLGEGMRETVMGRGNGWVEFPTPGTIGRLPLIAFDPIFGDVWIYTQRGKFFIGHLNNRNDPTAGCQWSEVFTADDWFQNGKQAKAILFNPDANKMEIAWANSGLTRIDYTVTGGDTFSGAAAGDPPHAVITFRPVESFAPRVDMVMEEVRAFLNTVGAHGVDAFTLELQYSTDRGATWTTLPLEPVTPYTRWSPFVPSAPSVTLRLRYFGPLGDKKLSVSKVEALPQVLSEEYPQKNPF